MARENFCILIDRIKGTTPERIALCGVKSYQHALCHELVNLYCIALTSIWFDWMRIYIDWCISLSQFHTISSRNRCFLTVSDLDIYVAWSRVTRLPSSAKLHVWSYNAEARKFIGSRIPREGRCIETSIFDLGRTKSYSPVIPNLSSQRRMRLPDTLVAALNDYWKVRF